MNDVTVSADRRTMTIVSEDGRRRAELRSELAGGFTAEHEDYARSEFTWTSVPGVHNCWRRRIFGRMVYLHINTGLPTWWWPRVWVGGVAPSAKYRIGAGWLRGLVEVAW